jgi:hypothetical protein
MWIVMGDRDIEGRGTARAGGRLVVPQRAVGEPVEDEPHVCGRDRAGHVVRQARVDDLGEVRAGNGRADAVGHWSVLKMLGGNETMGFKSARVLSALP